MRHDPASGAIVIMLRSLKMHGMAQAVTDLIEQGAPAFEAAVPILTIGTHPSNKRTPAHPTAVQRGRMQRPKMVTNSSSSPQNEELTNY